MALAVKVRVPVRVVVLVTRVFEAVTVRLSVRVVVLVTRVLDAVQVRLGVCVLVAVRVRVLPVNVDS